MLKGEQRRSLAELSLGEGHVTLFPGSGRYVGVAYGVQVWCRVTSFMLFVGAACSFVSVGFLGDGGTL